MLVSIKILFSKEELTKIHNKKGEPFSSPHEFNQ